MVEDRQSPPIVHVGSQSDRPSESSHYEALERARDSRRRFSRRKAPRPGPLPALTSPGGPAPHPDGIRGTHLDVLV